MTNYHGKLEYDVALDNSGNLSLADKNVERNVLRAQRTKLTQYLIYKDLSRLIRDRHNSATVANMAHGEFDDYRFWREQSRKDTKPYSLKISIYLTISRLFGITFAIKLLEKDNKKIQAAYDCLSSAMFDGVHTIEAEIKREQGFIASIRERRLNYISDVVLGLDDAIVELVGALAGFTLALKSTHLIAVAGLITGIASSLSMATSVYFSTKSKGNTLSPVVAGASTGIAYFLTVLFLVYPFLTLTNPFLSFGATLAAAVVVIFAFTFYSSVTQDLPLGKKFREMTLISLGVAGITFGLSFFIKQFFNLQI
jgi:vacuolar iron transporter family protein